MKKKYKEAGKRVGGQGCPVVRYLTDGQNSGVASPFPRHKCPIRSDRCSLRWHGQSTEEHQKAGLAEFEEVQFEVQDKLFRPKMQPALREYMTKLRAVAFLEIKPGYEDTGAAPGKDTAWSDPAQLKPETVTKAEVAARGHRKKLLGLVPIPGTNTTSTGVSSSK